MTLPIDATAAPGVSGDYSDMPPPPDMTDDTDDHGELINARRALSEDPEGLRLARAL